MSVLLTMYTMCVSCRITTEKRQFCIDPDLKWAKTQLAHFKASTTSISHPKHQPTIRSFVHRDDKQNTTESPK